MRRAVAIAPGLLLAVALAVLGQGLAHWLGVACWACRAARYRASALPSCSASRWPTWSRCPRPCALGHSLSLTTLLRLGIVLLGLRLSLAETSAIGLRALPVIAVVVITALLLVRWLAHRLRLPPRLGVLIGVGTSICGATAIVATAPTIGARAEEAGYAVACVALFGLLAMLLYPFVAHWLFAAQTLRIGLFFGTAVHDTAQVVGAGMVYGEYYGDRRALDVATVTKMVRNLAMIAVIPLLTIAYRPSSTGASPAVRPPRWLEFVPLFVLASRR